MLGKVRVYELAKELGLGPKKLVEIIQSEGLPIKNHMSALEADDAARIKKVLERHKLESTIEERILPTVVRRRSKTPVVAPEPKEPVSAAVRKPARKAISEPPEQDVLISKEEQMRPSAEAASPAEALPAEKAAATADASLPAAAPQPPAEAAPGTVEAPKVREGAVPPAPGGDVPVFHIPESQLEREEGEVARGKATAPGRRRELVRGKDLMESGKGKALAGFVPKARKKRAVPGKKVKKTEITTPKAIKRIIRIEETISLQELAKRMGIKATEVLMKLISMGMSGVNINSILDSDTAKIIATEFSYEVEDTAVGEEELLAAARQEGEPASQAKTRPLIITMMGHVDHGKTSLLDCIRKSHVAAGEAGGITQHIGAYRVNTPHGTLCFIDTPGHEAFTAMRARGANVTDLVVLVVAADDGVMPQTIEAANHAKAADVPIMVALNKIDLPVANPERILRQLADQGLVVEEWGGQTTICKVSARTGEGVDTLLEMLALQADLMELTANPDRPARGAVLEAYLDKGRGPVANVLVLDGMLRSGDIVVAGTAHGKIRALTDDFGQSVKEAGPSTPVEILGLNEVPNAGDPFDVLSSMKMAEQIADNRQKKVTKATVGDAGRVSLQDIFLRMQEGDSHDLKLIIKADVQGSLEALKEAFTKLSTDAIKVEVIHMSVGGITESDVMLASAAGAVIIGFNVRPSGRARKIAEEKKVDIQIFSIIYEAIDAVKKGLQGLLAPVFKEETMGHAEVRQTFHVPKVGTIAGCSVLEGKILRNAKARIVRDSIQIWEGKLGSLKRFKDDVREVAQGYECGISLDGFNDVKVGDVIEVFVVKEVQPEL